LNVGSKDKVHSMYDKAIALGATDEGEPGVRADAFYMAYFRDMDGNKIALFSPNT
jgi:predicted lactoylglutathione lyase